ncbi:hypothetical protein [Halobacteriovorax marinus]|uniref:hypothetical protein n=1 Tax=Halobacteriovorax marinus TaxID=97084 RepID=UPI003A8F0976
MHNIFSVFYIENSKIEVLVSDETSTLLARDIDLEGCTPLSKRRDGNTFFTVLDVKREIPSHHWVDLLSVDHFSSNDGAIICESLGAIFPFFHKSQYSLPELFLKKSFNTNQVTFFGGSFNPWHEGHSECLRRCPSENILIIPDRNPWKSELEKECYFKSFKELCLKFSDSPYSVFPGFYGLEEGNPTVDWLPRTIFKNKSLLIGDDNFTSFSKWKDYKELLNHLDTIFVLSRNHSMKEIEQTAQDLLAINDSISLSVLGEHDFMDLSSTKIRAQKKS